jgi:PAS domain S-box-containing protein
MLQYEDTPVVVSKAASSSHCSNNNALLETITTAAIALKPDGTARWMNEKARALTGWHESEFGRLPVFIELALRTPETHADIRFLRDENGIAKLDSSTADHLLFTDKNDNTHHISCACMGVENRAEECLDSILLLTDISEHFQISGAHDIGDFETDKLVDASEVATWAMNIDSGEVSVNKRWFTMLGYTPGELDPVDMKLWREIVHPDDHPQTIQDLDAHFQGNTPRYEADIRMKHKDGHWVWVHAVGKVSEWSGGRPILLGNAMVHSERERRVRN